MKILRISFEGTALFEDNFEIDFLARDRVINKSCVHNFNRKYHTQNVISLIGMNASGKTSGLRLIEMAFSILFNQESLKDIEVPVGLLGKAPKMIIDFFTESDSQYYRLESNLEKIETSDSKFPYRYSSEILYKKGTSNIKNKQDTTSFSEQDIFSTREQITKEVPFLRDYDSILFYNLKETNTSNERNVVSMIDENVVNLYRVIGQAEMENINIFDDSIENLELGESQLKVKFKNKAMEFSCSKVPNHDYLLSSGTAKGGNMLFMLKHVLKQGGYLIIDELENHFHKKLVQMIVDLFNDASINRLGATLIFTTHYAEVLDFIERKDNIFIFVRAKDHSSKVIKYSDLIKRVENKKSEVFLSNYIGGTSPSYNAIQRFKESIWD